MRKFYATESGCCAEGSPNLEAAEPGTKEIRPPVKYRGPRKWERDGEKSYLGCHGESLGEE